MKTSESIGTIAKAVIAFESEVEAVGKGAENPFFKSKYADLPSILQVIKKPLAKNGLGIIQSTECVGDMAGIINIITRLVHDSGEWVETQTPILLQKQDPQATGAGITYGRRYAIQALLNLSAEDDDGESAMHRPTGGKTVKSQPSTVTKATPSKDLF